MVADGRGDDGPSSIRLDPEPKDAARRRDLVRLWTAVLGIRINAPGVDRQRLAVGTDLKDDVIERVRRKEVHRLARCIGFRIAFASPLKANRTATFSSSRGAVVKRTVGLISPASDTNR